METMVVPYAVRSYTVIVHEAEEGGYWGEILELPGCVSQGETMDEFRYNIREALDAVLASESQEPNIEIFTEPEIAEQEYIYFGILQSHGQKVDWVQTVNTWTSTG